MDRSSPNHRPNHQNENAAMPFSSLHRREMPEFSDLILACRHHLLLTGVTGAIVAIALMAIAWQMIDPRYQAEALVRVREQQNVVFAAQTSRAEDIAFFRSQAKLVRSPQVLAAALRDPAVQTLAEQIPSVDRVAWLRGLLQVETESGSEVMSIAVLHSSPQVSHALSNAVAQAYLSEVTGRLNSDREQRQQELERVAHAADTRLDELWNELNQVAQSVGSDSSESLTIRDELRLQSYRDYARELQTAQRRGNELQNSLLIQQSPHDQQPNDDEKIAESMLQKHPEAISIHRQFSVIELQIDQLRKIATNDEAPPIQRLIEKREFLARQLDQIATRINSEVQNGDHDRDRNQRKNELAQLRHQIELNRNEKVYLRNQLSEIEVGVTRAVEKNAVPLDMSRHAVERQTRLADRLWQSLQELKIESQSQPRVTLLESAEFPKVANHSRQLRAAAAAGFCGWMLVVLAVGYREWRECRVRMPEDISSRSQFPVFGSASLGSASLGNKRGRSSEGVREAAARLMLRDQSGDGSIPSIMITSCVVGEPRHLVSLELAKTFLAFRRQVLLIDCDVDRSTLCRALKADRLPGLRQLSAKNGEPSASEVVGLVTPTGQYGIDLLPIGQGDDESWIDPRVLKLAIDSLRPNYDAIIVNGPAMIGSAENMLFASQVDTTLFSVFVNSSRWNQLIACERNAALSSITIGGSILHAGNRASKLALGGFGKVGQTTIVSADVMHPVPSDGTETELHNELDAMQQELRHSRSNTNPPQSTERPNQNSTA